MPLFIGQGRFTSEAMRGMVEKPEDRTGAVASLFESLGAKLVSWYMTTGEYDWLLIVEAPNHNTAISAAMVAAAGGGVTDIKTTSAFTGAEMKEMLEKARSARTGFKSAGH